MVRPRRARAATLILVASTAVAISSFGMPALAATADTPGVSSTEASGPPASHGSHLHHMGSYRSADYVRAATKLPGGLVSAVKRDLGISASQYLADAAASADAVTVVASLKAAGVDVLGSRVDGTKLIVNVPRGTDTAAVTATGASTEIGAPVTVATATTFSTASTTVFGGQPYIWPISGTNEVNQCSVGFTGYRVSDGARQFLTAGHCLVGTTASTQISVLKDGNPGIVSSQAQVGPVVGSPSASQHQFGSLIDAGLVNLSAAATATATVATWGGGTGLPNSAAPIQVTGQTQAIVGANLCKSGSRTGWTCGSVLAVDRTINASEDGVTQTVNSIIANTCILPGDSGGAAVIGTLAAGLDSTTSNSTSCSGSGYQSGFFPMVSSTGYSVQAKYGAAWELAVTPAAPVVNAPNTGDTVGPDDTFDGSVASAGSATTVSLFLDGSTTAFATVSASSGSWSIPVDGIDNGDHDFAVVTNSGRSHSSATSGSFTMTGALDRFAATAPTITGSAYVDATLTAHPGTYTPAASAYAYQWKVGGVAAGTDATYVVQQADVGKTITLTVTVEADGYRSSVLTSKATAAVILNPTMYFLPTVTGSRHVWQTLTATVATRGMPIALKYQWLRNGVAISGATSSTYHEAWADYNKKIDVKVTGTQAGWVTKSARTATTAASGLPYLTSMPTPTISGAHKAGSLLTAHPGSWAPAPVTLHYQWRINNVVVKGATANGYRIPASAVGKTITVVVSGARTSFTSLARASEGFASIVR